MGNVVTNLEAINVCLFVLIMKKAIDKPLLEYKSKS